MCVWQFCTNFCDKHDCFTYSCNVDIISLSHLYVRKIHKEMLNRSRKNLRGPLPCMSGFGGPVLCVTYFRTSPNCLLFKKIIFKKRKQKISEISLPNEKIIFGGGWRGGGEICQEYKNSCTIPVLDTFGFWCTFVKVLPQDNCNDIIPTNSKNTF